MKTIYRVLTLISILVLSTSLFAGNFSKDFCPPVSMIKPLNFVDAEKVKDGWLLASEIFEYQSNRWYVIMGAAFESKTVEAVLHEGQVYFTTKAQLQEPINALEIFCDYSQNDRNGLIIAMKFNDQGPAKSAIIARMK